jgi:amino acid transporter
MIDLLANGVMVQTEYQNWSAVVVSCGVSVIGAIITALGVFLALRTRLRGKSEVSVPGIVSAKNISQGVVVAILGSMIVIYAVRSFPVKKTEVKVQGQELIIDNNKIHVRD